MKLKLPDKYLPLDFKEFLYEELLSLKQGSMIVDDYTKKFNNLVVRCHIDEGDRQLLVCYMSEWTSKQPRKIERFRCGEKGHFASLCPTKNLNLIDGEEADQQNNETQTIAEEDDNERGATRHRMRACPGRLKHLKQGTPFFTEATEALRLIDIDEEAASEDTDKEYKSSDGGDNDLNDVPIFLIQRNRHALIGRATDDHEMEKVVDALYDCKSEVIGPGFFRFKAEIGSSYDLDLAILGNQHGSNIVLRLEVGGETCAHQNVTETERGSSHYLELAVLGNQHGSNIVLKLEVGGETCAHQNVTDTEGAVQCALQFFLLESSLFREAAVDRDNAALLRVMSCYGEEVVNALASEADRLEKQIQELVPGIRHVDIEAHNPIGPSP
ncbi:Retrotransposon gag domain [Dillenia turbinata]|uniref:Retrotransposon gag domain n=1 Tax=Dillenia turbinata TaxID=194707 RepID=A0AAN8UI96_9MAGN